MPLIVPELIWRAYGAVILSFMAGVQWGFAVRSEAVEPGNDRRYAFSVLPSLLGWISLACPPRTSLLLQLLGFLTLLGYDLWTVKEGAAPSWYARLRIELSAVVGLCLLFGLVRGGGG